MALFRKKVEKYEKEKPQIMQINLIDIVKQAAIQMKYEEIGSWLMMHKTPLFFCHDKGISIVDKTFIEQRPWLKRSLNRMIKEIDEMKQKAVQQAQQNIQQQTSQTSAKPENAGYIG
jgi:hypothetical protein